MQNESKEILKRHLPEDAVDDVFHWLQKKKIHLKITRKRTTKLGDYRPPVRYPAHRISVNGDLNTYSFLITFLHELAHLLVFEKYGRTRMPHGTEWKQEYENLLVYFIDKGVFPADISQTLLSNLGNSKASSNADIGLTKILKKYDKNNPRNANDTSKVFLEELNEGEKFVYGKNRFFIKLEKRRTRFRCKELSTGRIFIFHPLAEVQPVTKPQTS
jgi:hypothetical protein